MWKLRGGIETRLYERWKMRGVCFQTGLANNQGLRCKKRIYSFFLLEFLSRF